MHLNFTFSQLFESQRELIGQIIYSTNNSLSLAKTLHYLDPSVPLTTAKELQSFLAVFLILNFYPFPRYSQHFDESSPLISSRAGRLMTHQRFTTLMKHVSLGNSKQKLEVLKLVFRLARKGYESFESLEERLFLRLQKASGVQVASIVNDEGYIIEGLVLETSEFSEDQNLKALISSLREERISYLHTGEDEVDPRVLAGLGRLGIKEIYQESNKGERGQKCFFKVMEDFEFLDKEKREELSLELLIGEIIMKDTLVLFNREKQDKTKVYDLIVEQLVGEEKEKAVGHFAVKLDWCKKCAFCAENDMRKKRKKSKYKCSQCSLLLGKDVALCLKDCFGKFHEENIIRRLWEKKKLSKKRKGRE